MPFYVYCLADPRTQEIRYIGKTVAGLSTRLSQHCYAARDNKWDSRVNRWIRSLMREGLKPTINPLSITESKEALGKEERRLIAHYREQGARLTNLTDGGDGSPGRVLSPSSIEKMRKSHIGQRGYWTGKKRDPETGRKISIANKGRAVWNKGVKGQKAWNKGIPMSEESKARISLSRSGKGLGKRPPELCAKISAALKGKPGRKQPEETRRKISEGMRQYRAKLAAMREGVETIPQGSRAKRPEAQGTPPG
mgnify:CR=1 FL=1